MMLTAVGDCALPVSRVGQLPGFCLRYDRMACDSQGGDRMSEWDTDVAVVSDEDEARAIGQRLTAAGISHLVSRQPPSEGPFHVKVQAKDLSTAKLTLWSTGKGRRERGSSYPPA